MPNWAGKWKGGRYYLNPDGRPVYFIERRRKAIRLDTHDEELAKAQLAQFLTNPDAFQVRPETRVEAPSAVHVDADRIRLYLQHIRDACDDHKDARESYLKQWANYRDARGKPLDLRTATKKEIKAALATFKGGHRGRVEALNAFARFLVKERDQGLETWAKVDNPYEPKKTRAERVAYTAEELRERWRTLPDCQTKDVFLVRVATGLHQTEIDQLEGAAITKRPLPDAKVAAIRELDGKHEIAGVLQVHHKNEHRHRVSVTRPVLEAAMRLTAGVPNRVTVWKVLDPIVPSNLRHTFETLAEDAGRVVTYTGAGVDRTLVAQVMGHRAGSTMISDRYNQSQVPPMVVVPLGFP